VWDHHDTLLDYELCDEWMFVVCVGVHGWRGVGVENVGWWMCVGGGHEQ